MTTFLGALALLAAVLLTFVVLKLQSRRVSGREKQHIAALWKALDTIDTPTMKLLHADAVLGKALQIAGYTGSVGDMLKQAGPRFSNEDAVWKAHKLRNMVAHEPHKEFSHKELQQAIQTLKKATDDLS